MTSEIQAVVFGALVLHTLGVCIAKCVTPTSSKRSQCLPMLPGLMWSCVISKAKFLSKLSTCDLLLEAIAPNDIVGIYMRVSLQV